MKNFTLGACAILLLSACASTPSAPPPAWALETTPAEQRMALWNFDGVIPAWDQWPGVKQCSGGIVGFSCNLKTIDRGLSAKKIAMPSEYAALYSDPIQAESVTSLIQKTYIQGNVPADEMGTFLSSKYGQRYLRANYVYQLADKCGEKLSKAQRKQLDASLTHDSDSGLLPAYNCASNSAYTEKPLPAHTVTSGFDLEAAKREDNA